MSQETVLLQHPFPPPNGTVDSGSRLDSGNLPGLDLRDIADGVELPASLLCYYLQNLRNRRCGETQ
jgi:hypothetical protein